MKTLSFISPVGYVILTEENEKLIRVRLSENPSSENFETPLLIDVKQQLGNYFDGKLKQFDCKIELKGTKFQKQVWKELQNIPFAQTKSYKQIAENIGKPKAVRAVANAIGRNPISIIIPCHRVIGADGSLTGYYYGLKIKKFLLDLEKASFLSK